MLVRVLHVACVGSLSLHVVSTLKYYIHVRANLRPYTIPNAIIPMIISGYYTPIRSLMGQNGPSGRTEGESREMVKLDLELDRTGGHFVVPLESGT